jgi:hypothetical protein
MADAKKDDLALRGDPHPMMRLLYIAPSGRVQKLGIGRPYLQAPAMQV